ncbi:MAG: 1-acyl-sn-glycerol-3-phosphate acyltransferase, partial [Propionibacterium sp.]
MWYWFFKFTIFRPLVKRVWRAVIIGEENIPKTGGAIIAANHIANIDSIVVPALLERRLTYPVKAELFSGKTLKIKIVGW